MSCPVGESWDIKRSAKEYFGSASHDTLTMLNTKRLRRHLCYQQFNGNGSRLYFPKEVVTAELMRKPADGWPYETGVKKPASDCS